jgi:hypothetical protein
VEEDKREFSLGITSLADSTAIGKKKSVPVLQNRDAPDTDFAGYPVCRIYGQSKSRIPDFRLDIRCRPNTEYPTGFSIQLSNI